MSTSAVSSSTGGNVLISSSSSSSGTPTVSPSSSGVASGSSSDSSSYQDLILIVVIGVVLIAILAVCRSIYKLYREQNELMVGGSSSGSDTGAQDDITKKNWKIDYMDIEIQDQIGQGQVGKVFKGKWRGLTVACKEIIHTATEDQIQQELALLIKVRHPNLVLFMGIAQASSQKLYLISEHMARGNLYTVIHDKSIKLDWKKRIGMALDIARSLNYLHCCKPPILHKTLNSINVLVDKELVAKIADYGLDNIRDNAKKSGIYTQPLWVAPEILKKGAAGGSGSGIKHTSKADVYSFAIILWELLTRKTPYQGKIKANNNVKAIQDIINGMRPEIPQRSPPKLTDLLTRAWHPDPSKRPSVQAIVDELVEFEKEKIDVSIFQDVEVKIDHPGDGSTTTTNGLSEKERKPWMVGWEEIKLDAVIGQGSFGEVWSGSFRGKKVAIKKLTSLNNQNNNINNNMKDFIRELNLMCSLRHPNTILFMGAVLDQSNSCIIMEYCDKGNLYDILHDVSQPIDYNRIIKILTEIAEGVMYLHLNNPPILHRDLKSVNILIDEHWDAKVSDFGLTDFKPEIEKASNLQQGTPFWLAPECMERQEFSEASDVYSFGMIIWELFTREMPFMNLTPHQAALAVITEDKRPDIPAFVPPRFAHLIQGCWIRDPTKRPTFPHIIEALRILKSEGLPRIELSLSNAKLYRKKTTVFAFKSKDAVIVYKPWGTGEGKKGDWVIVGPGDDVYTCDAAIFMKTYSLVDVSKPHLYRKTGSILALEMERDFLMETLEGMEHGKKGDVIAQNPVDGEQWPIAAKSFKEMYELAPSQTLDETQKRAAEARARALKEKRNSTSVSALGAGVGEEQKSMEMAPLIERNIEEEDEEEEKEAPLVQRKR